MENNHNFPLISSTMPSEDIAFQSQLRRFFDYLTTHVATSSMVSVATGIPQKNCTRFKARLENEGKIWEVVEKQCKQTGRKAWYLSTDPSKATSRLTSQLNLL